MFQMPPHTTDVLCCELASGARRVGRQAMRIRDNQGWIVGGGLSHRCHMLTTQIMLNFYNAVIESVLAFSITVWFGTITVKEKFRLNRVVNTASKIISRSLPSLESLY